MPRIKLIKPSRHALKPCPVCALKAGSVYCRRCHGPRTHTGTVNLYELGEELGRVLADTGNDINKGDMPVADVIAAIHRIRTIP